MKRLRDRIDDYFGTIARHLYIHPWKTLGCVILLVMALATQLAKIEIDTSTEGLLYEKDPALMEYHKFRKQFGRDQLLIVALHSRDIFAPSFLETLQALHRDLEAKVPHIEKITSLINARDTHDDQDGLVVSKLFADWPQNSEALERIKQRALANPLYRNTLISEDFQNTAILIETNNYASQATKLDLSTFDDNFSDLDEKGSQPAHQSEFFTEKENSETVEAVLRVVKEYQDKGLTVHIAGSSAVTHCFAQAMIHDLSLFFALAVLVIAVILYVLFRRLSAVFLPLLVVMFALISTVGIMAAMGIPLKLPTQVLPPFILAVGVGYAVHILAIFYHSYQCGNSKHDAIVSAMRHSGLPVTLTAATTAGGLLSFLTAEVKPIANLGLFTSIGVLLAMVLTYTVLPPLIAVLRIKTGCLTRHPSRQILTSLLNRTSRFVSRYPYPILIIALIIIIFSVAGLQNLRFSHDVIRWLPEKDTLRTDTEYLDDAFRGSFNLELIIDSGKVNGLYDPKFLNQLEQTAAYLETLKVGEIFAGKTSSLTFILKEINQALHGGDHAYYHIAQDRRSIAQQFLLFENSGSEDLEDVCDRQFQLARLTVKVPLKDAIAYGDFIQQVDTIVSRQFPEAHVTTTGMIMLYARTMANTIRSMANSYLYSFIVITFLMILLIGNVRIGLISMIPNLAPIVITLGLMGWFHFPLNLFTIMIGSIAIGLAVDDTIHFMHNLRKYYEQTGSPQLAVRETFLTVGRAMTATSCVLAAGFFIFMFAELENFFQFGLLTGFTIIMALMADFFIGPALMIVILQRKAGGVLASHIEGQNAQTTIQSGVFD